MYTLDEINVLLSDLDACSQGYCADCSRSGYGRMKSMSYCLGLDSDAAAVIRWLLSEFDWLMSEFDRYAGEQLPIGEVDANA